MKIKFFQALTIVFLSLGLSAQTEQMPTSKEDTFRINLKEKEILIIDKNQNNKKKNEIEEMIERLREALQKLS